VWDRDRFSPDDMVGAGCLDITELIGITPGSTKAMPIDLYCHGQLTGRINMRVEVGGTLEQSQILAQNMSIVNANRSGYPGAQQSLYPDKTSVNSTYQQSTYPDKTAPNSTQQQGFYSKAATSSTAANQYQRQFQQQPKPQSALGIGQRPQKPPTQQSTLPIQSIYQNGFGLRR